MKKPDLHTLKKKLQGSSEVGLQILKKVRVGARVKVHHFVIEGNRKRIQVFEGIVIAIRKPNNPDGSFVVRKVSFGVGVEKTFPINSPNIAQVEVLNYSKTRRAKIYFLRSAVTAKGQKRLKLTFKNIGEESLQEESTKEETVTESNIET